MRRSFLPIYLLLTCAFVDISADAENPDSPSVTKPETITHTSAPRLSQEMTVVATQPLQAFTGKIVKNKVRLRTQPSLDGPVFKMLGKDDLLIIVGETDEFYAVLPPNDMKAYVYRTFILDNVVEGSHVNVRLQPDLESPIIAQLNSGDRVQGAISPLNSKWLEINPPETSRFYVCKEYVIKVGDRNMMAAIEKKRSEVNDLLSTTYALSQDEMLKSYENIHLENIITNYNKIIHEYTDFPVQSSRAKELLGHVQDEYLQKKIAYLEEKTHHSSLAWQSKQQQLNTDLTTQQNRIGEIEQQLHGEQALNDSTKTSFADNSKPQDQQPFTVTDKMSGWIGVENAQYDEWKSRNEDQPLAGFYQQQREQSEVLQGILEPYSKSVKNKPGDFILVNKSENLPIAYLYSTQVNLQDKVGQEVRVRVSSRPNNNFAFPAFFVLDME